jgi:preprotein translocase subunit SecA
MFAAMMDAIKEESVGYVFNLDVQVEEDEEATAEAEDHPRLTAKGLQQDGGRPAKLQYTAPTIDGDTAGGRTSVDVIDDSQTYTDIPRNAPCPCGSGKRFKRCHGDPRSKAS